MDERLAALLDEQDIRNQLCNYCRSMDRCDKLLGRACFHPDAEADYGEAFQGSGYDFVDFAVDSHLAHLDSHLHRILNILVSVDGDRAGSESYVDAKFRSRHDGQTIERTTCGRYVDEWEKRDDRWAIARRRYLHEMDEVRPVPVQQQFAVGGSRDLSDVSYAVLGAAPAGAEA
jgi:SnoaL-like domain